MFYTAIEENDSLTVMFESQSLFDATCSFYELFDESGDEIELGEYFNDEMIPLLQAS